MNTPHVTRVSSKVITAPRLREKTVTDNARLNAEDVVQSWLRIIVASRAGVNPVLLLPSADAVSRYLGPDRGVAPFVMKISNESSLSRSLTIRNSSDGTFTLDETGRIGRTQMAEWHCEYDDTAKTVRCFRWRP